MVSLNARLMAVARRRSGGAMIGGRRGRPLTAYQRYMQREMRGKHGHKGAFAAAARRWSAGKRGGARVGGFGINQFFRGARKVYKGFKGRGINRFFGQARKVRRNMY